MRHPTRSPKVLTEGAGEGLRLRKRRRKNAVRLSIFALVMVVLVVGSVQLVQANLPDIPVTTSPGKSGAVTSGQSLSCVAAYSPEELAQRDWAADVTVTGIKLAGPDAEVTLRVDRWFHGGATDELMASMSSPWVEEDQPPAYGIGTRLLVSGSNEGGHYRGWPCGFSRYYSQKTAAAWARVFE